MIPNRREEKKLEIYELAKKVNNERFDDYKEKQKVFKAKSKIGKWFHKGGTYKKR